MAKKMKDVEVWFMPQKKGDSAYRPWLLMYDKSTSDDFSNILIEHVVILRVKFSVKGMVTWSKRSTGKNSFSLFKFSVNSISAADVKS